MPVTEVRLEPTVNALLVQLVVVLCVLLAGDEDGGGERAADARLGGGRARTVQ